MPKRRIPNWLLLMLAPFALLLVGIPALWILASLTATPVHPNPESVPTVIRSAPSPKWTSAADQARQIVRAAVSEQNLPGLSVAVGIDGDIVWAEGFGFADLKNSVPVTPEHRFRIGTASTALTSAAAGLLLESGRLKLDEQIRTYVPPFPDKGQPVTLREVMGHISSIYPDDNDESPLFTEHCERPVEAVQHYKNWILFKPEDGYSIYDWIIVSAAIEAAADQPFLKFMQERIFDPLGMRDTLADPATVDMDAEDFPLANMVRELIHDPDAARGGNADTTKKLVDDRPTSYSTRFRSDPNYGMHVMRPLDYSCFAGSSGFVSTPSDLVRFAMAMNSGKLLKPATVELLQTSQILPSGEDTGYGLGWDIDTAILRGKQTAETGHDGHSPLGGRVASLMTFPEYGIVVAVTSNIAHADTFSIGTKVAQAFVAGR